MEKITIKVKPLADDLGALGLDFGALLIYEYNPSTGLLEYKGYANTLKPTGSYTSLTNVFDINGVNVGTRLEHGVPDTGKFIETLSTGTAQTDIGAGLRLDIGGGFTADITLFINSGLAIEVSGGVLALAGGIPNAISFSNINPYLESSVSQLPSIHQNTISLVSGVDNDFIFKTHIDGGPTYYRFFGDNVTYGPYYQIDDSFDTYLDSRIPHALQTSIDETSNYAFDASKFFTPKITYDPISSDPNREQFSIVHNPKDGAAPIVEQYVFNKSNQTWEVTRTDPEGNIETHYPPNPIDNANVRTVWNRADGSVEQRLWDDTGELFAPDPADPLNPIKVADVTYDGDLAHRAYLDGHREIHDARDGVVLYENPALGWFTLTRQQYQDHEFGDDGSFDAGGAATTLDPSEAAAAAAAFQGSTFTQANTQVGITSGGASTAITNFIFSFQDDFTRTMRNLVPTPGGKELRVMVLKGKDVEGRT